MIELYSTDLKLLNHTGSRKLEDLSQKRFAGVSTDSRTTKRGEIFFALRGDKFDGHRFVNDAFSRGAAVAVVDALSDMADTAEGPVVLVHDTTRALGELARHYREKFEIPVIAIGGSNGKTTTKDMIAQILGTSYRVASTAGNFNNHIGVPLTLFQLTKKHEIAVVEIGTNHPGEIEALCDILRPTHGLVTTIGKEHLEFFGSIEGVAAEEGTLYKYLRGKKKGTAFVYSDDEHVVAQSKGAQKIVRYGFSAPRVHVKGKILSIDQRGCARFQFARTGEKKSSTVILQVPGEHHALNALAAASVGLTFDVPSSRIRQALMKFRPASKRMEVMTCAGVLIYNDTYNANPDSMIAALRTLACTRVRGKKIAVLAEMRELGEHSYEEHARVGKQVVELGIDYLLTYGESARVIYEEAGIRDRFHYDQKNVLAEYLLELLSPGDAVLVKGSRSMKMEDVVTFVQERLRSTVRRLRRTGTG